jgi:hypothetical protein
MKEIVFFANPKYQTYAVMDGDHLRGYVLLTQHKKREAYDKTAEVTIYLSPDAVGQGFGSLAVQHIEAIAKNSGIHVLVATICQSPERLKVACGGVFELVCVLLVGVEPPPPPHPTRSMQGIKSTANLCLKVLLSPIPLLPDLPADACFVRSRPPSMQPITGANTESSDTTTRGCS